MHIAPHRSPNTPTDGFSMVELMVVIAIIGLLIALLLPTLGGVRETTKQALCAANQSQLRKLLQSTPGLDGYLMMPPAGEWVKYVSARGGEPSLICPADEDVEEQSMSGIEGYYVYQVGPGGNGGAFLTDMAPGTGWTQAQSELHRIVGKTGGANEYDGDWGGSEEGWPEKPTYYGKTIAPDDFEVGFQNDAALVLEMSAKPIKAVSVYSPESPVTPYSDHYLSFDKNGNGVTSGAEAKAEAVLELAGKNNKKISSFPAQAEVASTGLTSYGMNVELAANPLKGSDKQVLLLDYRKYTADYNGVGTDDVFEEQFAGRHFGRANVLRLDGSVTSALAAEDVDPSLNPDLW